MPERHPISQHTDEPPEDRLRFLEEHLAQLWDQVWWLSLPPERRDAYRAEGFTDPILHFYIEE